MYCLHSSCISLLMPGTLNHHITIMCNQFWVTSCISVDVWEATELAVKSTWNLRSVVPKSKEPSMHFCSHQRRPPPTSNFKSWNLLFPTTHIHTGSYICYALLFITPMLPASCNFPQLFLLCHF
uniref:Uncharacterized protein n=1 Tax=Pipistrellus kuhlii TaxID=59472 RepID=A0A7J7W346_PIPKU|nr:hypothetical protein mPipKuh1_008132 [Pipistrellus kuhlii]